MGTEAIIKSGSPNCGSKFQASDAGRSGAAGTISAGPIGEPPLTHATTVSISS